MNLSKTIIIYANTIEVLNDLYDQAETRFRLENWS